jgi:hypothetical protein
VDRCYSMLTAAATSEAELARHAEWYEACREILRGGGNARDVQDVPPPTLPTTG